MNQHWQKYAEEFEDLEEREIRKAYKNRPGKKLDHKVWDICYGLK